MSRFCISALVPAVILFTVISLHAQTPNELINSGRLLEQGEKFHDDGKYKQAIDVYKKIPRSDTNYSRALYELALSSYSDSDFTASKQYAELGLKLFPDDANNWYALIANSLDDLGQKDKALAVYDTILKASPYAYVSIFNKGVTLYNLQKYKEAKELFQKTLLVYPFYTSAHYFLGKIYYAEGNMPAAMLCFSTALAINPNNRYRDKEVDALSNIAKVTDDVEEKAGGAKPGTIDNFELLQEILFGKIALDAKYKLQTDLEDPITRQLQAVVEKLEYNKNDNGFCMQFYVPFYKSMFEQKKFNALVFFMFSGLDVKQVQDFNKKHKKEIDDYIEVASTYFDEIKETEVLNATARAGTTMRYYLKNGVMSGKGAWRNENNNQVFYGPWEFYYPNGQLKSKGLLDDHENKDGEWFFYYKSGVMKEHSFYSKDSLNGKCVFWFDNGNTSEEATYNNGGEEGEKRTYFYNRLLREISQYAGGKKNGPSKEYKSTGELSYAATYKDGLLEGAETYYYYNGKILSTAVYANGKADGPYKKYAENGVLIMDGNYQQDKPVGAWKTWYPSGKLKEEYGYENGDITGEYKEYFENGQVKEHTVYVSGKEDGKEEYYNENGKPYSENYYEKGKLRELKFYDANGNVAGSSTTRNGAGLLTFYNMYGNKINEGNFTKDGQREGQSTSYFEDGKVSSVEMYKKGSLNGEKVTYYNDGSISTKLNYTDDKEDGYYTSFYQNSKPAYAGWFVQGDKQGAHNAYNIWGQLTSVRFYRDGEEDGYSEYFNPNGKKDYEELYSEGWLKSVTQFDSTGKVLGEWSLPKGDADFTFRYNNGKTYIKAAYRNYHLHGRYDAFYLDGSAFYTRFYKQGRKDSTYKQYYFGGKLEREGKYVNDQRQGLWNFYYNNGQLHYNETYEDGELQGKSVYYNEDGTLNKEYFYKDNDLEGKTIMYGDNNQVVVVLNYHDGRLLSYTYMGKDGKPVEAIPFVNQSGTLTAYYSNGTKSATINFKNGRAEGTRTTYFSNGKVFMEGERLGGLYQGIQKKYNVNGQLLSEENYYYDNLHGVAKYYYPNGKIKAEENWYNGDLNGECKYYDETGKLKQTRFYYYGTLESVQ